MLKLGYPMPYHHQAHLLTPLLICKCIAPFAERMLFLVAPSHCSPPMGSLPSASGASPEPCRERQFLASEEPDICHCAATIFLCRSPLATSKCSSMNSWRFHTPT